MSKLTKNVLLGLAALSLLAFASCNEGEFVEPFDADVQFQEDLMTIEAFIIERGLDVVDTTVSSVRYSIKELGEGELVEVDDVITLDFVAYLAETGQMLQTSMQEVADTSEVISTPIDPLVFRHTINGWGLNDVFSQRGGATATNGFRDGLVAVLNVGHNGAPEMRRNGTAIILIPSQEIVVTIDGANSRPPQFPTAVVTYEIAVRNVRK